MKKDVLIVIDVDDGIPFIKYSAACTNDLRKDIHNALDYLFNDQRFSDYPEPADIEDIFEGLKYSGGYWLYEKYGFGRTSIKV